MGKALRAEDINVIYTLELDYDSSNNLIYLGSAKSGTATSSALWRIKKLTYDSSNNLTNIQLADGNDDFDNVYDDRASLSYS